MKKINFNKIASLASATFFVATALVTTSCKDEDAFSANNNNGNKKADVEGFHYDKDNDLVYDQTYTHNVIALTFDRIPSASDVTVNNDTTIVNVNKAALSEVKGDITKPFTYLAIWQSKNVHPFYVAVESYTDSGNDYQLKVKKAGLADVIDIKDYHLSTELYTNPSVPARTNGGEFNTGHVYNSADDTYHPYAILSDPEKSNGEESTNISKLGCVTIEELEKSNFDWSKDKTININKEIKDKELYCSNDSTVKATIDKAAINSQLVLHIDINTGSKWEKVRIEKNSFGGVLKYVFNTIKQSFTYVCNQIAEINSLQVYADNKGTASVEASYGFKGKFEKKDQKDLVSLSHTDFVFMLGPVPVLIDVNPTIIAAYKFKAEGHAQFKASVTADLGLKAGAKCQNNNWSTIWEPSKKAPTFTPSVEAKAEVSAQAGVYLQIPVRIDAVAGPNIKFGPEIAASAVAGMKYDGNFSSLSGAISEDDAKLLTEYYMKSKGLTQTEAQAAVAAKYSLKTSLDFKLGGSFGADIKIYKWTLAKVDKDFDIWKYNLYTFPNQTDKQAEINAAKAYLGK